MSNRISIIQGTSKNIAVDLVDEAGQFIACKDLIGASAELLVRLQPTDVSNVLRFSTIDTPTSLAFEANVAVLDVNFVPSDTATLAILLYFYRLRLTLATGAIIEVIPWDIFDVNLGGAAVPAQPPFSNTKKIDQDYPLANDMTYQTPGGSPIENAQVRLYYKSDYIAGKLDKPIGITMTDAYGKWRQPILVIPGYTYVARLEKANEFGPDIKEFFA